MLAIQLHRRRMGGSRWQSGVIRIAALISAVGCVVGGALLLLQ